MPKNDCNTNYDNYTTICYCNKCIRERESRRNCKCRNCRAKNTKIYDYRCNCYQCYQKRVSPKKKCLNECLNECLNDSICDSNNDNDECKKGKVIVITIN